MADCRALLRGGSRSFYMASFLLPRETREAASALYAFCRLADDAIDVGGGSHSAIEKLRTRLDLAYDGRPLPNPVDRAFAATVEKYEIPKDLPNGLITGLEWDAASRTYETLADLRAYATRVAGTVGAMMALVMGARQTEMVARACDLGVAMQLTNIARDVGEDARMGRIYLPLSWMREAGIDIDAWSHNPSHSTELKGVIGRLLDAADELYRQSDPAIRALPLTCRPGIHAARLIYAEIGHELRRSGCDSVSARAVVSTRRKLQLLPASLNVLSIRRPKISGSCMREARFLVEAITPAATSASFRRLPKWWDLHGRVLRLIHIFEQLERRQLAART